jgi:hypothetical protein
MGLLYGRAGRLNTENGGFRPGQWSKRLPIMLRTSWPLGASLCAYKGDSFFRSTRFFVMMMQILVSMGLNVVFYIEDTPERTCEEICRQDDPRNEFAYENMSVYSNITSCIEGCEYESYESNNEIYSSLISAGIAIPVMGLINFGFGWLRRPLNADMLTKAGATLKFIEKKENEKEKEKEKAEEKSLDGSEQTKVREFAIPV